MQFAYTILYVEDVAKSIAFYTAAFGFQKKFMTPEEDYGELLSGETTLAFASHHLGQSNIKESYQASSLNQRPFGLELAFTTSDIEEDFAKAIAAGALEEEPISTKPWGQQVGYLRDINGFLIEICTPMMAN